MARIRMTFFLLNVSGIYMPEIVDRRLILLKTDSFWTRTIVKHYTSTISYSKISVRLSKMNYITSNITGMSCVIPKNINSRLFHGHHC